MAYSKPIHAPSEWVKHVKEVTLASVDEELLGFDELVAWALECGMCDVELVNKYVKKIRPYQFLHSLYPILPDNTLCREFFKVLVHYTLLLYIGDDQMEQQSEEEGRNMCDGFKLLDDQSRKSFPEFPTVEEMKKIVIHMSTPSAVARTVMFASMPNKLASLLLKHGSYSDDVVYDLRLRASNMISIYIQAVLTEKHQQKQETVAEAYWRRVFGGCTLPYHLLADICSGALGKTKQHITGITEMYLFCSMFCIPINDVFSYYFEKETICDNMFKAILAEKEEESIPEAIDKISQIVDAIAKRMYMKMQETLLRYPKNQELHSLFDYLGRCAIGWFWMHHCILKRYTDSPLKLTLVELDDEHITPWLSKKNDYGEKVVSEIMEMVKERMADGKFDALNGAFPIHEKLSGYKNDGLYDVVKI